MSQYNDQPELSGPLDTEVPSPESVEANGPKLDQDESLIEEQKNKFKEGQILQFVRVRFPGNAKSFPFLIGKRKFIYGQKVVAMSDRGMAVGYINSFPYETPFHPSMLPIRSISKVATAEDLEKQKNHYQKEKEAEKTCLSLVQKHQLDMNITHVEFTQFGKKAVFYFTAPQRVDFRGLVKDLVSQLKMRIELRQISVRDRAAAIGGIGPCGLQLCCSSFLSRFGSVNIKMAKNQNLTLIPSKLNGVCGQLKCCMRYEDDVYSEKRSYLPEEGSFIQVQNGDIGRVTRLHLMEEQFEMLTDKGIFKRYSITQFNPEIRLPEGYKFPEEFSHITNETSHVIGQAEYEQKKALKFRDNLNTHFPEDKYLAFKHFNFLSDDEVEEAVKTSPPFYLREDYIPPKPKIVYDKDEDDYGLSYEDGDYQSVEGEELIEEDFTAEGNIEDEESPLQAKAQQDDFFASKDESDDSEMKRAIEQEIALEIGIDEDLVEELEESPVSPIHTSEREAKKKESPAPASPNRPSQDREKDHREQRGPRPQRDQRHHRPSSSQHQHKRFDRDRNKEDRKPEQPHRPGHQQDQDKNDGKMKNHLSKRRAHFHRNKRRGGHGSGQGGGASGGTKGSFSKE